MALRLPKDWFSDNEEPVRSLDQASRAIGAGIKKVQEHQGSQTKSADVLGETELAPTNTKRAIPNVPKLMLGSEAGSISSRFVLEAEWEGVVDEFSDDGETFAATLRDLSVEDAPRERGDFFIDHVRADDIPLLQLGAIFRWVVGTRYDQFGTRENSSRVVFRRLPAYTKGDLERAENEAAVLIREFKIK